MSVPVKDIDSGAQAAQHNFEPMQQQQEQQQILRTS